MTIISMSDFGRILMKINSTEGLLNELDGLPFQNPVENNGFTTILVPTSSGGEYIIHLNTGNLDGRSYIDSNGCRYPFEKPFDSFVCAVKQALVQIDEIFEYSKESLFFTSPLGITYVLPIGYNSKINDKSFYISKSTTPDVYMELIGIPKGYNVNIKDDKLVID